MKLVTVIRIGIICALFTALFTIATMIALGTFERKEPSESPTAHTTPENWQLVDADQFTLSLPPDWHFQRLPGVDSCVGKIVGDGARLGFDFGRYSNSLAEDNDPKHSVTYEIIDGYRAKIVVPKAVGDGMTGIYFGELKDRNKFNLFGSNLNASRQETALNIFRTIQFKK